MGAIVTFANWVERNQLKTIFILGIVLRIFVFLIQEPCNPDSHITNIEHILNHHEIPISRLYSHSFHPPLYYLLAAPFFKVGGAKTTQFFSLIISVITLLFFYLFISKTKFINDIRNKVIALGLAAFLPEFVMFTLFISNDTLSFLLGCILSIQLYRYMEKPNFKNECIMAVLLGLGILTKGTMLIFIPVCGLLILLVQIRRKTQLYKIAFALTLFTIIFSILGFYKFYENIIYEGRPLVHSLDWKPSWAEGQRFKHVPISAILDFNIIKLIKEPILSAESVFSLPLQLYGSFYYKYMYGDNNFIGWYSKFKYIGSIIYLFGLLPMLLIFTGFFLICIRSLNFISQIKSLSEEVFNKRLFEILSCILLIVNFALVIVNAWKYDVWSFFTARLFFQSLLSIIILFNTGLEFVRDKFGKVVNTVVELDISLLYFWCVVFFVVEGMILLVFHYFNVPSPAPYIWRSC